ncbi:zinc-ribbon domain-containing protein [Roseicyclus persicicus]|uniref:Thioredoxin n=1 Tax=Roseicyclus persicicus TaxID=2650661 RepID=A0A7X6JVT9_9RHOB|nr:zinc-ribbon domain-containing protein [Roseibacterium persicicum]NKX43035.1 thioredoxin [Roseibacterium persicicum]
MRLTCPNCSARYEVADSMIPPEGRDVQCSNCSTTWFQPGRRTDRAQPAVTVDRSARAMEPPPPPPEPEAPPVAQQPEPEPEPAPEPDHTPDPDPEARPDAEAAEAPAPVAPRRREIDPAVRDILREEAEREARLRQAEAEPVETQAEMPLAEEPEDRHRARRRAELEAARDAFAPEDPAASGGARRATAGPARDLFPDIDQINSTLRDTGDRTGAEPDASDIDTLDTAPRRRRGVRLGFLLAIALAAGGAAVYVNAGRIADRVPALAPAMAGYTGAVDAARIWLDDLARRVGSGADGA